MAANNGGYKVLCPACGERMRIQSGPTESNLARAMLAQCQNFMCGATYQGTLSWDYVLTQSSLGPVPLPPSRQGRPQSKKNL